MMHMILFKKNEDDIIRRERRAARNQLGRGHATYDNSAMLYYARPATHIRVQNALASSHKYTRWGYSESNREAEYSALQISFIHDGMSESS